MTTSRMPPKDPDSVLPYWQDWGEWLVNEDNDEIETSTWEAPDGITIESSALLDNGITQVWLSGGTEGEEYTVTNHIVTTSGREDDRSFIIPMKER